MALSDDVTDTWWTYCKIRIYILEVIYTVEEACCSIYRFCNKMSLLRVLGGSRVIPVLPCHSVASEPPEGLIAFAHDHEQLYS